MKTTFLLIIISFLFSSFSIGQCAGGRYSSDIFSTVTVTSDVNYGSNSNYFGVNTNLTLDVYEPSGDVETARPLIIWAHGGSFVFGSKTDPDMVELSTRFAKKGFVCASIKYRLGMWPIDSVNAIKAVVRTVQDMRASIRFFYKDKATTNTYKIDTSKIFIAGSSAGAITALHVAYLDKDCEIQSILSPTDLTALGGAEGTSGNTGYSSDVIGVIGLAGALVSYGWLEGGDIPLCMTHGDNDGTVGYNRGTVNVGATEIMTLDGSRVLTDQANNVGVQNNFYTHYGAGHVPHYTSSLYMDTTVNFVRDFLIDVLGCADVPLQEANPPSGMANLYTLNYCGLSITENEASIIGAIYPNPSDNQMTIEFTNPDAIIDIALMDLSGRILNTYSVKGQNLTISKGNLVSGSYILRTVANGISSTTKITFF